MVDLASTKLHKVDEKCKQQQTLTAKTGILLVLMLNEIIYTTCSIYCTSSMIKSKKVETVLPYVHPFLPIYMKKCETT
jgi:hypothetical protein